MARVTRRRKKHVKRSLLETIEPSEIERGFLSERDQKIQIEDLPERFQLRSFPVEECQDDGELMREADWIFRQIFSVETLTIQQLVNICS